QLGEALDALGDRLEVRQEAAEPSLVDVWHAGLLGGVLDRVARLLLRPDEEDRAAAAGHVRCELLGGRQQPFGLLEVDDVDPAALAEYEPAHLRVPAACLVAEVHSGLQQLAYAYLSHYCSLVLDVARPPAGRTRRHIRRAG